MLFEFENKEEASKYYGMFDYEKQKLPIKHRIKILFCKHDNEHKLDMGSRLFHYVHCPNCKRAIYVNDESEEDREIRIKEMWKNVRRNEIKDLEKSITSYKDKLLNLKEEFKEKYCEEV